ncbi:Tyrosine-protein kinase transmembrane receptor Ror [Eumeta japonica]|uniref:Tyrosine-protein kinase receptor n=1 Tax=Eumeta variegata TaxID=151549 RepID=A0A4C1V052_EUMVA|nr:Tyrosine-protein kinase transmembrane receptor Ror [Eumeta japonica]
MSDLLSNQNVNLQPNPNRNVRGNGVLRIPQYSLSQIKFLEELGEGAFGKVYKGALNYGGEIMYVAVKALKENASAKTKADFRREIELISELRHDNIVAIVGVALREEPLCMLFEFMARGDLHEFLMGRAPPSGKGLPSLRLLNIAHNIASGMQYLASHHYVHRDLAARNCLVSDDFIVKISDFGLSRDIYSSDYYRVQSKSLLPVRWMPPESILYGKFTTESDIWSYGVVLWEIYSYGLQPYYGYSNQEVIAMVRGGELLASPAGCPNSLYGLMRDCWRHTPHTRPTFEDIVNRLLTWIQMGGCPDNTTSESSSTCAHRQPTERVPLLAHCSSSNGSLAGGSLKKLNITSSNARIDDNCSTCSDAPPTIPRSKKGSCGSLLDPDRPGPKDTVVRIPNTQFGNEI